MRGFVVSLLIASAAFADYAEEGPLSFSVSSDELVHEGRTYAYDLYAPSSGGPWPVIALAHGYSNAKENLAGYGRRLASRGNLVVVPQFPFGSEDHPRHARVLLAALDQVMALGAPGGALQGRVDGARQALGGHSWGALAALLAAAQRSEVRALVLLDPVEGDPPSGGASAPSVKAPTLWLLAEPDGCNGMNSGAAWYAQTTAPRGRLTVVGGKHCDPQDPVNTLCDQFCPGTQTTRTRLFERYAVAWLQYFTSCESAAREAIDGAQLASDVAANAVTAAQFQDLPASPPCPLPDGGTPKPPAPDAGATDAGTSSSPPSPPTGCGCHTHPPGIALLTLAAVAIGGVRRHRAR